MINSKAETGSQRQKSRQKQAVRQADLGRGGKYRRDAFFIRRTDRSAFIGTCPDMVTGFRRALQMRADALPVVGERGTLVPSV
jgi:hypothetical protein